jgi:hypothetical protein
MVWGDMRRLAKAGQESVAVLTANANRSATLVLVIMRPFRFGSNGDVG